MVITYKIFEEPSSESNEELLERLKGELQMLELKHYNYKNRTDKEDNILTEIENEINAKVTEYTDAGGTFD
jgi:hypothetical protein